MVDYSGVLMKLDRAQEHLQKLDYLVFTWLRGNHYKIVQEANFETERYGFYISLKKPIPAEIPSILGDVVHNLRVSLDHIVSACAIANGKSFTDTGFPFGRDANDFKKRLKDKARKAGDAAMILIAELKPYPTGNDALVGLHNLDLIDKHRILIAVAAAGDFRYRHIPRPDLPAFEEESRVYFLDSEKQFIPTRPGYELETPFEIGLALDIVFPAAGPFGNMPCVAALRELLKYLREIVGLFQKRCP